jgi:uncharacterized protein
VQEDRNYGMSREPDGGPPGGPSGRPPGQPLSPRDEQTWSVVAHLSVLTNLLAAGIPIVGVFVDLFIWLVFRDRSERVAFHALQSLWYQVAWLVILVLGWFMAVVLSIVFIGFLLMPILFVLPAVPLIHMCYAAYRVNQGEDYRYPFIADRIDSGRIL